MSDIQIAYLTSDFPQLSVSGIRAVAGTGTAVRGYRSICERQETAIRAEVISAAVAVIANVASWWEAERPFAATFSGELPFIQFGPVGCCMQIYAKHHSAEKQAISNRADAFRQLLTAVF